MGYTPQYYRKNRAKILKKTRQYALAHPEVNKRSLFNRRMQEHEMTPEQYEQKLRKQKRRCAICGKKDTRQLCIDHAHACCPGENSCKKCNRDLLCNACNKKLAAVEDTKFLKVAIAYLKKWEKTQNGN